jgi:hypothetical protein
VGASPTLHRARPSSPGASPAWRKGQPTSRSVGSDAKIVRLSPEIKAASWGALVLDRRGGRVDAPQGPGASVPPGSEDTACANGSPRNLRGSVISTDESRAGAPGDQLPGLAARAFGADGSRPRTLGRYRQPKATKSGAAAARPPRHVGRPVTSSVRRGAGGRPGGLGRPSPTARAGPATPRPCGPAGRPPATRATRTGRWSRRPARGHRVVPRDVAVRVRPAPGRHLRRDRPHHQSLIFGPRKSADKGRAPGTRKVKPARARELQAKGMDTPEIAQVLGTSTRTVFRYLQAGS